MTTPSEPKHTPQPAAEGGVADAFVGRRQELKAIGASLDAAAAGEGRLEIVSGAPGIGKTRLAHEVATIAQGRGFSVLRGGCWEGEGAPAYWPWADVLRSHLSALPDEVVDTATASDFSELLDVAATRVAVPIRGVVDATKDAQQARFMLFDRFCEFLAVLAASQPVLVIVDDVQFADTGSLLLLQFLAGRLAQLPITVLITSREPLSEAILSISRQPWARQRVLRGLTRSEARTLLSGRVPRVPPRAVLDQLMHLTEGNPYFLKELGHQLVDANSPFDGTDSVPLPASLLVITLQTYRQLSADCRSLLQAASVVGREFDAELVAHAAGLPIRDALALLDEAVARRVIAAASAAHYHFIHAIVREAVHAELHLSDRTRFHERIALALAAQAATGDRISAATLAHHFIQGLPLTQRRQAALHSITAGQAAHAAYAYEEAVTQFRRAQDISGASLTELESCDLLLHLGSAQAGAGEWSASRRTFEDAAATARDIGCPESLARAALGFKGMMWATTPVDSDAVALLEEARSTLGPGSLGLRIELLSAISRSLHFSNHPEHGKLCSDKAVRLASSVSDKRLRTVALEAHTMGLLQPGKAAELLSSAATLVALADELRDAQFRFNARIFRQCALLSLGRISDADSELETASQISHATPYPRFQWQISILRVARATLRGQLSIADQLSVASQELGTRVHDWSPKQYDLLQGLHRALLRDDLGPWIAPAEAIISQLPNIPAIRIARALVLARLGHTDLAQETLYEFAPNSFSLLTPNSLSLWLLTALAEIASLTKHESHAKALYSILLPYSGDCIVAGWGTLIDGSVSHYLALLAGVLGLSDAATDHFQMAISFNRQIGAPALTARSALHFALHLSSSNVTSGLQALAKGAAGTFESLELTIPARRARELLASLGAQRVAPGRTPAPPSNTFRREGDYWIIAYDGTSALIRNSLGLQYLARLLSQPGTSIHCLDLVAPTSPASPAPFPHTTDGQSDRTARTAYRQRLRELTIEIDLAETNNDLGWRERLIEERDRLYDELSSAFSLSGSPRPYRSNAERARISVRNRISAAIRALRSANRSLALHMERSIKTGALCVYAPVESIPWEL